MPRFIAVHTGPFTEEAIKEFAKIPLPEGVSWEITYCDFEDQKFFCHWVAPKKEMIEAHFKANSLPFDFVYPVRIFNPAKIEFE